jgi:predicted AAA+ superfamily ATPase
MEDRLARDPLTFEREILLRKSELDWVVVDEVQRVPKLLNLVHKLIEAEKIKFALTGSSSRKLKRGSANLLAGRAFVHHLHPLSKLEIGEDFDLQQALRFGTLPQIFQFQSIQDKEKYLRAYALTYLREEIQAEQLIRKLDPFRRFLEIAAQMNGKILNWTRIAREAGTDIKTIQSYFSILEETWLGFSLPAFHRSIRKAQKAHPKFYFFDTGIARSLAGVVDLDLRKGTSAYGETFEHFILLECFKANSYEEWGFQFSYLRTKDDNEIDLILHGPGRPLIAIEIKSTTQVDPIEVRRFENLAQELNPKALLMVSNDPRPQKFSLATCIPWEQLVEKINSLLKEHRQEQAKL